MALRGVPLRAYGRAHATGGVCRGLPQMVEPLIELGAHQLAMGPGLTPSKHVPHLLSAPVPPGMGAPNDILPLWVRSRCRIGQMAGLPRINTRSEGARA